MDWFVVLPDLVILVEVKSRRLGPAARAGDAVLLDSLSETLGGAKKQLSRTVERLADHDPAFAHIPTDRPMLGLIVTAEPYYTAPSYLLDHDVAAIPGGSLRDVPVAAASARDIESLFTHGANVAPMLLAEMNGNAGGVVSLRDLGKQPGTENPILLNAWNSCPWQSSGGTVD